MWAQPRTLLQTGACPEGRSPDGEAETRNMLLDLARNPGLSPSPTILLLLPLFRGGFPTVRLQKRRLHGLPRAGFLSSCAALSLSDTFVPSDALESISRDIELVTRRDLLVVYRDLVTAGFKRLSCISDLLDKARTCFRKIVAQTDDPTWGKGVDRYITRLSELELYLWTWLHLLQLDERGMAMELSPAESEILDDFPNLLEYLEIRVAWGISSCLGPTVPHLDIVGRLLAYLPAMAPQTIWILVSMAYTRARSPFPQNPDGDFCFGIKDLDR